jgi:Uma2 family endonuclease
MTATAAGKPYLFTARQYDQMIASRIFDEGPRVELLGGEIIEMAAMGVRHATCLVNCDYALKEQVGPLFRVGVQIPILLDDLSEPEPDVVVYKRRKRSTPPLPSDILLVVEVAESLLDYDRNQKFPRYAAAGIAEAWLLDLTTGILERHTEPHAGQYRHLVTARAGETLDSTALATVSLAVAVLLAEE